MSADTGASAVNAKEQVARLLTLVPFLHARGSVRLGEAATALGVAPEVVLRDLKVLFMCGLPGGYPDDLIDVDIDALQGDDGRARSEGVVKIGNADYLARPLRLTAVEATAVIVALRALRDGAAAETAEIVDRALAKLESAAASGPSGTTGTAGGPVGAVPAEDAPGQDVGALATGPELADLEARLTDAAGRGVQVELDYYVPTRDELSHRTVDPRGVVRRDGHAYLDAYCHSAEAPRLFRLDRVARASVLDTAVTSEPTAPRDLADGLFTRADDVTNVTLRLTPAARWVVEYYPVEAVRPLPDGDLEVDVLVADERWLTKLLLRLAPNAQVTAPADWTQAPAADVRATLALYDTRGAAPQAH